MLDLDTNLDLGNIHLHRGLWLSGRLAVQAKAWLCSSNANTRTHRAGCKAAGGAGNWAGRIAVARLVDFAARSQCVLRCVGFGRKTTIADDGFRGLWCRLLCRSRFWLVLVRSEIGLCRQIVRGGRRGFHRCLLQGEHLVVIGIRKHRIPTAAILALVPVNASVAQAGIFVPLEFVHGIVHQGIVEYSKRYQQLKVLHRQTGDLLEQTRLQLGDHILQAALPVVGQIHEHRNAGGKLDKFFLNLLALGLVLFFLVRKLLLLFRGKVFGAFLLCLLHLFGLGDDGFDVRVQAAEALDFHQGIHSVLVGDEAGEGLVVYVHQ